MRNRIRLSVALLSLSALAGCGDGGDAEEAPDAAPAAEAPSTMPGMEVGGMAGGHGMDAASVRVMGEIRAHMQAMHGAPADSVMAGLPAHRRMVADMLSRMSREMRDTGKPAGEEWRSAVDSLRRDLTAMPEMSADELEAFMPEHRARVERLMEMHHGMMADMPM